MGAAMKQRKLLSSRIIQDIAKSRSESDDDDNNDRSSWTTAQILLRWSIQKGNVVIPGTGNPKHIHKRI